MYILMEGVQNWSKAYFQYLLTVAKMLELEICMCYWYEYQHFLNIIGIVN